MRYRGWVVNRYSWFTHEVSRSLSIPVAGLGSQHFPVPLTGPPLVCLASAETRTWTDVSDGNVCTFLVRDTPFRRSFSYLYDRFLSPVLPEYTDEEDKSLRWCNVAYSFQTKYNSALLYVRLFTTSPCLLKLGKKTLFCWLHNILSCVDAEFDKWLCMWILRPKQ